MKIFLICSKHFYPRVPEVQKRLEEMGHSTLLPNSFDKPNREFEYKDMGPEEHAKWKGDMLRLQAKKVASVDAVLVINEEKNGVPNYIGGATFLEIFKAFELGKKIFFFNPIPEGMLKDELLGMQPTIINQDLSKVV